MSLNLQNISQHVKSIGEIKIFIQKEIDHRLQAFDQCHSKILQKPEVELNTSLEIATKLKEELIVLFKKTIEDLNSSKKGANLDKKDIIEIEQTSIGLEQKSQEVLDKFNEMLFSQEVSRLSNIPNKKALGIYNETSTNCWANSLINFCAHDPELLKLFYRLPPNFQPFIDILLNHLKAEIEQKSVTTINSKDLRLLLNKHFDFAISAVPRHEDAHEALSLIMGQISCRKNRSLTEFSPIFSIQETTRRYQPTGKQKDVDPKKSLDDYSQLDKNHCSKVFSDEWQLFLDIENKGHLGFEGLVKEHCLTVHTNSEPAYYLEDDKKLHEYKLIEEGRKFTQNPKHLLVVLKRFNQNEYGQRYKINSPIAVPLHFTLPKEALSSGEKVHYELTSFIEHMGIFDGGHYVAYVKQSNGRWIRYDDSSVSELSEQQILTPLQSSYIHHYVQTNRVPSSAQLPVKQEIILRECELKELTSSFEQMKKNVEQLQAFALFLEQNPDNTKQKEELYKLSKVFVTKLHWLAWLHDGVKDIYDHGKTLCDQKVDHLKDIKKPYFVCGQGNILTQMAQLEKEQLKLSELEQTKTKLRLLKAKALDPQTSNEELKNLFYQIDQNIEGQRVCDRFHGLVYQNDPKPIYLYGKQVTDNDVRVLLKIQKPLLSLQGTTLIDQMIHVVEHAQQQEKNRILKGELEAFEALLQDPSISDQQLAKYFDQHLNSELKEKLSLSVWLNDNPGDIYGYGENEIKKNPRRLLSINTPLLAANKGNLLRQLISLLS